MAGRGGSSSWPRLRFPGALVVRAVMPRKLHDTPCVILPRGNLDTCLRSPRVMVGGRNGGSVGRSHRGGTLRVLRPAKYDKSSSLTRVEPPRWFTARRKLVKFKSAFKTGLARCPGPPCSRYCQREIPPGSDRSLSL
ncbi:hypothetical protein ALC56_03161 [Trachymyrmex septentrionalis]|uniref:Uncharacterized protein n=1 Tax=Trachymyrmex septentrionalis TaxID=34720 RepID=A0A151JZH6_9HYME|nr:hypothetical protein ALC56_03161 [Trachymyrmex septentrionalis]